MWKQHRDQGAGHQLGNPTTLFLARAIWPVIKTFVDVNVIMYQQVPQKSGDECWIEITDVSVTPSNQIALTSCKRFPKSFAFSGS